MKVKLIRDKLALIPKEGVAVIQLDDPAHRIALVAKMHEEAAEIADKPTDVNEYADLFEAMVTLANKNGIQWEDIWEAATQKYLDRGGFEGGAAMVRAT